MPSSESTCPGIYCLVYAYSTAELCRALLHPCFVSSMYSFCLFFVLIAFVVAAQNETWTPPALFVQKRQLAQGVGDQAGGLAAFGDGGAQNTEAPTTSTIIAQKPPPSVTTTLGYTANLTSLLPQIPTNQYATITSLISCMEANGQYSATDNGTSLSAVTITVPGALTGRGTTIVSNEYTYTGCDGIPRVTWSGGTPSGLNYTIMPFTNPASLLSLTYTTKTNAPCTPDTQLASSYCNAFVTIRNEEDRIFTSASRRGTVYQDLIRTWGPPEFTCTRFDDPNPYIASCRFGVEAAELLYCKSILRPLPTATRLLTCIPYRARSSISECIPLW